MTSENMQMGIYLIDRDLFPKLDNDAVVDTIIEEYNAKTKNEQEFFHEETIRIKLSNYGFKTRLFFGHKKRTPKWKYFWQDALSKESKMRGALNYDASYIAFVFNNRRMFALSGGQGNFVIQDYINQSFGLEIVSRLISENSKVVKSIQVRGLTGMIMASTKFFRGDYRLADDDEFGKFYKQINAELSKNILSNRFGFNAKSLKKGAGCIAKSSFQINKSIDLAALFRILMHLDILLTQPIIANLNKVRLISGRGKGNKGLRADLENIFIQKLYECVRDNKRIDADFCHPDYEDYLTASTYEVCKGHSSEPLFKDPFDELTDINDLFDKFKQTDAIDPANIDAFSNTLERLSVISKDAEGKVKTKGSLLKHIHMEMSHAKKTYFRVDDEWYEIEDEFLTILDRDCKRLLEECRDDSIISKPWNAKRHSVENNFNNDHIGEQGTLVLDKILPDDIEPCDLLKFKNGEVFFIHIKRGFNNSMRDLTAQVHIAARRIMGDLRSNKDDYIGSIYDSLVAKKKSKDKYFAKAAAQIKGVAKEAFVDKLRGSTKQIFCLGIYVESRKRKDLSNPGEFRSNIAKFALLELHRKLRGMGVDLKIAQIKSK